VTKWTTIPYQPTVCDRVAELDREGEVLNEDFEPDPRLMEARGIRVYPFRWRGYETRVYAGSRREARGILKRAISAYRSEMAEHGIRPSGFEGEELAVA